MAGLIHNQLTNYAQLLTGFRRMLGEMGADFSGIERAGETLTPILNPWTLPEWALLRGETIFSREAAIGAGALTFQSAEFVNPVGSGVLAVLLEVRNVANTVQASVDSGGALGAVATVRGVANDTRFPQLGEVSRVAIVTGSLAAGVTLSQELIPNLTLSTHPYVVQPGRKVFFINTAVNQVVQLNFLWTERALLPNEQNP